MDRVFIEGFDKRYSINTCGVIVSHYKYSNQKEKVYKSRTITPYLNRAGTPIVCLYEGVGNNKKRLSIPILVAYYFKITKPDKYHRYTLKHIDGNPYNNSVENLQWRISLTGDYNYYPSPIYDQSGTIISKICSHCGKEKNINDFVLQKQRCETKHPTYKNKCKTCIASIQYNKIKNDPVLYSKKKEQDNRNSKKESSKIRMRKWAKQSRDNLDNWYLSRLAKKKGINYDSLDDAGKDIVKTQVLIKRQIKSM